MLNTPEYDQVPVFALSLPTSASDSVIALSDATALTSETWLRIDQELLQVQPAYASGGLAVPVLRGQHGTIAAPHAAGALVINLGTRLAPRPSSVDLAALNFVYPDTGTGPYWSRSPTFPFVPRTIGRAEDEELIGPMMDVAYDPTNFTTVGGGTWTVPASSINTHCYQRLGHLVAYTFYATPTTIAGTPTYLEIKLPLVPPIRQSAGILNYGVAAGVVEIAAGSDRAGLYSFSGSFAAGVYLFAFSNLYYI